jgi:Phosphoglycerate kinase
VRIEQLLEKCAWGAAPVTDAVHDCRPFAVIIGGAKVADKIGILWHMIEVADKILVGGRMAFTFLAAQGVAVGRTSVEADWLSRAKQTLQAAKEKVRAHVKSQRLQAGRLWQASTHLRLVRTLSTHTCDAHYQGASQPVTLPGSYTFHTLLWQWNKV